MLRILFVYKQADPLSDYLLSQLKDVKTDKKTVLVATALEKSPEYIEKYDLNYNHTLMITNFHGTELYRLEGPFNKEDIAGIIQKLKEAKKA